MSLPSVQLVWATDEGYAEPTAVSIHSALHRLSGPSVLHLLIHRLEPRTLERLEATVAAFPACRLVVHDLENDRFSKLDVSRQTRRITPVALGRQILPRLLEGQALYIDGDTIAVDDLRPLATIDLEGAVVGVIRNFNILWEHELRAYEPGPFDRRLARLKRGVDARLGELVQRTGLEDTRDYFNSGVMVIDCSAILADPELLARFEDMESAAGYKMLDQDWLNRVVTGRAAYLDPRWNTYWGNVRSRYRPFSREASAALSGSRRKPGIVHYPGRRKPWHPVKPSRALRDLRWRRAWHAEARRWRASLPENLRP